MHLNLLSHGNIFAFELQIAREDLVLKTTMTKL